METKSTKLTTVSPVFRNELVHDYFHQSRALQQLKENKCNQNKPYGAPECSPAHRFPYYAEPRESTQKIYPPRTGQTLVAGLPKCIASDLGSPFAVVPTKKRIFSIHNQIRKVQPLPISCQRCTRLRRPVVPLRHPQLESWQRHRLARMIIAIRRMISQRRYPSKPKDHA